MGLAGSIYFTAAVLGMGIMLGLDPLVAQAAGSGNPREARRGLAQAQWLALVLGVPLALMLVLVGGTLDALGVEAQRAEHVRSYLWARAPGLVPYLGFVALRSYLQAVGAARSVLTSVVWGNVAMLVVAPPLVFGIAGTSLTGLGVSGAGWAESACTVLQLAVLLSAASRAGGGGWWREALAPEVMVRAVRVGLPVGLQLLAEFGIFALVNFLVAVIDAGSLAAHNVAITLASTAFMVPVGIGAAASVRVGHGVGRGDPRGARLAGSLAMLAGGVFMSAIAIAFMVFPRPLAGIITNDSAVVEAAVPLLAVAAAFQIFDGVQTVAAGALRGAGDTRFTLVANLAGHYCVGLPVGLFLGVVVGLGACGLWWGLAAGLCAVAIAVAIRFIRLSARSISRL